jgi:hypothetical protein
MSTPHCRVRRRLVRWKLPAARLAEAPRLHGCRFARQEQKPPSRRASLLLGTICGCADGGVGTRPLAPGRAGAIRSSAPAPATRLYEEGLVVKWRSVFRVVLLSGLGLERRSCLYGLLIGRIRRNWMFARAQVQKGRSGRQTKSGASGSELLLAGKHVPDRVGESARDVDLGDLGAALLSEPPLGSLVALGVGGVP